MMGALVQGFTFLTHHVNGVRPADGSTAASSHSGRVGECPGRGLGAVVPFLRILVYKRLLNCSSESLKVLHDMDY